ncbi:hypothetical protein FHS96_000445 [Sphingomonas zeicaulis]|uniref:hypothetical protein n=1 Tax=Sphingomonas zeicaulis TaxID=1632740 RepID=UPI003D1B2757
MTGLEKGGAFALACALMVSIAGCAAAPARPAGAPFPPDVESDAELLVKDTPALVAPPLWPDEAAAGYRRRIRLLLLGTIGPERLSIEFAERTSGRIEGHVVRARRSRGKGRMPWRIIIDERFEVSRREMAQLDALIAKSNLWEFHPEFWTSEDICVDGEIMVLERRTPAAYSYSEGNTYCTTPDKVDAVWLKMIEIAGGDRLLGR